MGKKKRKIQPQKYRQTQSTVTSVRVRLAEKRSHAGASRVFKIFKICLFRYRSIVKKKNVII